MRNMLAPTGRSPCRHEDQNVQNQLTNSAPSGAGQVRPGSPGVGRVTVVGLAGATPTWSLGWEGPWRGGLQSCGAGPPGLKSP